MKERPILFSGPMVRAILGGYKTQTRRIVKPQPPCGCRYVINGAGNAALCQSIDRPEIWVQPTARSVDHRLPCPYGQPGDRLWVRETFAYNGERFIYRADQTDDTMPPLAIQAGGKWKPSIFCTRAASRITLEVTAVRVERLQSITEADASAEGTPAVKTKGELQSDKTIKPLTISALTLYRGLWSHINGPGSWDANPWVWVIEFRRIPQ
jgi:hypothetical protein